MTIGEKIRKFRMLHGKTQRQLGEEVGFKKSTADVRIAQYESDKMAPKVDIRSSIANALDIDIEAISDINISTWEDIMHVLFEFEETLGMEIDKKDGKTYLSFNDNNKSIRTLITYLNIWKNKRSSLPQDLDKITEEQRTSYALWKSRFVQNTKEYFRSKEDELNAHYTDISKAISKNYKYAKNTSDLTLLLRKMIEAGVSLTTTHLIASSSSDGPGFTFKIKELLSPATEEIERLFSIFLLEIDRFRKSGIDCQTELLMTDSSLTITYFIPIESFTVIQSQIDDFIDYMNNNDKDNDYIHDSFEEAFKDDLETYNNDIEEEIKLHLKVNLGKM